MRIGNCGSVVMLVATHLRGHYLGPSQCSTHHLIALNEAFRPSC